MISVAQRYEIIISFLRGVLLTNLKLNQMIKRMRMPGKTYSSCVGIQLEWRGFITKSAIVSTNTGMNRNIVKLTKSKSW